MTKAIYEMELDELANAVLHLYESEFKSVELPSNTANLEGNLTRIIDHLMKFRRAVKAKGRSND